MQAEEDLVTVVNEIAMHKEVLQKAYDLFTQSARSFPDSYVAAQCHKYRVILLKKLGKPDEAMQEEKRVNEFFPD